MTYEEARAYLDGAAKKGIVLGLDVMKELLERLGNPQEKLRIVHIAGTNGKGSILTYMEQIFLASGYHTARYVSPVIGDYEERFLIDGKAIGKEKIPSLVFRVKEAAKAMEQETGLVPTVFEIETAMAFLCFQELAAHLVLLETGMGGRLDATNIIKKPYLSVIGSVSLDHMGALGNSLEEIAAEKAGIIKEGCDVLCYPENPKEVTDVILRVCEEKGSICHSILKENITIQKETPDGSVFSYGRYRKLEIFMPGRHQIYNAVTAVSAVEFLKKWFCISEFHVEEGLRQARWKARLEKICESPRMYLDGAHNRDGAKKLGAFIRAHFKERRILAVAGVLADKEYDRIMREVLPMAQKCAVITPDNVRALDGKILLETAKKYCPHSIYVGKVVDGIEWALKEAKPEDVVIVFGSLSFMGEIEVNYGKISKDCSTQKIC